VRIVVLYLVNISVKSVACLMMLIKASFTVMAVVYAGKS